MAADAIMTIGFIAGIVLATMVGMWILSFIDGIVEDECRPREKKQPPQS